MLEEFKAEAFVQMRPLDDPWKVREKELCIIDKLRISDVRPQSREGVWGDLGKGPCYLNKSYDRGFFTAAKRVDLPAFGKPMKPMSAINLSFNSSSFFSPSWPNLCSRSFL